MRLWVYAEFAFPVLGSSLLSGNRPPSPLELCKILKANGLFYDYLLDL